jgi:hypothetical protein
MVVKVINQNYIRAFEGERNPPIAAYPNGPMVIEASAKRVKLITRRVHIACHGGYIQSRKQLAQPFSMILPDSRL